MSNRAVRSGAALLQCARSARLVFLLFLVAVSLAACGPVKTLSETATPPPAILATPREPGERRPTTASPTAVLAVPALAAAARPAPVEQVEGVATLEGRFFAGNSSMEKRLESIQDLGRLGTPAAGEALGRIFQRDKRQETRLEVLQAAAELPEEACREQRYALLLKGVEATQGRVLRLGALLSLADLNDPRCVGLLRNLAADGDVAVRAQAADMLKETASFTP